MQSFSFRLHVALHKYCQPWAAEPCTLHAEVCANSNHCGTASRASHASVVQYRACKTLELHATHSHQHPHLQTLMHSPIRMCHTHTQHNTRSNTHTHTHRWVSYEQYEECQQHIKGKVDKVHSTKTDLLTRLASQARNVLLGGRSTNTR